MVDIDTMKRGKPDKILFHVLQQGAGNEHVPAIPDEHLLEVGANLVARRQAADAMNETT